MGIRLSIAWAVLTGALLASAPAHPWLARVEPVINSAERNRYLALSSEEEREAFRAAFWRDKTLSAEEYFERVDYADAKFGSGQAGSGANTDQGRVYVALGPPVHITYIPSSRILQPVEIWRYDHIPGLPVSTEIQLLFFQQRGVGFLKLYSPQIHTIRSLLINDAGTRGALPVNDIATADDLLNRLQLSPTEMEAVDAAMSVARGVKGSGNSEILYKVSGPAAMIRRELREKVQTRLLPALNRPELVSTQYRTGARIPAIDITVATTVTATIGLEATGIETVETRLGFAAPAAIAYHHRLYLLPGDWDIVVISDGQRRVFPLHVNPLSDRDPEAPAAPLAAAETAAIPVIYRANLAPEAQWTSLGRQYLRANDLSHARTCFHKALAANPQSADALAGSGRLLALEGRLDEARDHLRQALALQPNHYEALTALAAVTAKFQDYPQALVYYRQAESIRPSEDIERALRELARR